MAHDTVTDAISDGFLNRYFSMRGRIGRFQYLCRLLLVFLTAMAVMIALLKYFGPGKSKKAMAIFVAFDIPILYSLIAITVKRFHDFGRRGAWLIFGVVPVFAFIILIICLTLPGNRGSNSFGPGTACDSDSEGNSDLPKIEA